MFVLAGGVLLINSGAECTVHGVAGDAEAGAELEPVFEPVVVECAAHDQHSHGCDYHHGCVFDITGPALTAAGQLGKGECRVVTEGDSCAIAGHLDFDRRPPALVLHDPEQRRLGDCGCALKITHRVSH